MFDTIWERINSALLPGAQPSPIGSAPRVAAGTIMRMYGYVGIKRYHSEKPEQTARPGMVVYRGDVVHTYDANVLLRLVDGTQLHVGTYSLLVISPH